MFGVPTGELADCPAGLGLCGPNAGFDGCCAAEFGLAPVAGFGLAPAFGGVPAPDGAPVVAPVPAVAPGFGPAAPAVPVGFALAPLLAPPAGLNPGACGAPALDLGFITGFPFLSAASNARALIPVAIAPRIVPVLSSFI